MKLNKLKLKTETNLNKGLINMAKAHNKIQNWKYENCFFILIKLNCTDWNQHFTVIKFEAILIKVNQK